MGTKKRNLEKQQLKKAKLEKEKNKKRLVTGGVVVVALAVLAAIVSGSTTLTPTTTGGQVEASVFQTEKQPTLGSAKAPVQIVEFADFKCPACQKFEQTILPQLKKEYVDTGIAKLSFINYPIISPNADSRTAAMAGEAVYQQNPAEFWKFYEAVFAQQGDERTAWATPDALVKIAEQSHVNVNLDKLKADLANNTYAQAVRDDEAIVKKLGVDGTPTIYVNGVLLPSNEVFSYDAIKAAIAKAQEQSGS